MGLELNLFLLILASGVVGFILGHYLQQIYLYILGSIAIMISGFSIFVFDGLIIDKYYSEVGGVLTLVSNTITTSNIALQTFGVLLVVVGFVALWVFMARPQAKIKSTFHY